jgi:predicted nucleic acid-binding protein
MARLVLSDSSPLIGLAHVDGLCWLRDLFGSVAVTPEVLAEVFCEPEVSDQGRIRQALAEKWLRPLDLTPTEPAYPHLGDGETSCLRVALARAEPTLLLLDDRLARREARRAGLQIIGVAAIIGMAEQRQLIPSARVVFDALLQTDFRIGVEVIQSVLDSLVATRGAAR